MTDAKKPETLPTPNAFVLIDPNKSLFAGMWPREPTREEKLAQPIRAYTILWLATELAIASRQPTDIARQALIDAIPHGDESVLDGGREFIFCVDEAAIRLGCNPFDVNLCPPNLES